MNLEAVTYAKDSKKLSEKFVHKIKLTNLDIIQSFMELVSENFHCSNPLHRLGEIRAFEQGVPDSKSKANFALQLHLRSAYREVSDLLQRCSLTHIPVKGLYLEQLYRPIPRTSGDLDILVSQQSLSEIIDALGEIGYRKKSPGEFIQQLEESHSIELINSNTGIELDLHFRMAEPCYGFMVDLEGILSDYPARATEFQLLFSAIHSAKSGFSCLRDLLDIAVLYNEVVSLDKQREAQSLFRDSNLAKLFTLIQEQHDCLIQTPKKQSKLMTLSLGHKGRLSKEIAFLSAIGFGQKLKYLFHLFFIPRDTDWDTPFPYLLKPFRTLKKFIQTVKQR